MPHPLSDWSLRDLEKAYQEGHRARLGEHPLRVPANCREDVLAASWEAGWHDTDEQLRHRRVQPDAPVPEPRFPALLKAQLHNSSARPPLGEADYGLRMQRLVLTPRDIRGLRDRTVLLTSAARPVANEKKAP